MAGRLTLAGVSLLIVFNLLLAGVDLATGGPPPAGPPSSSYATASEGLAAYADLLAVYGHPVDRLRRTLDEAELDLGLTVVLADPDPLSKAEQLAMARFVSGGGRVVAAGAGVEPLLRRLLDRPPVWAPGGDRSARAVGAAPEIAAVSRVRSAGLGSWVDRGATEPILVPGVAGAGGDTTDDHPRSAAPTNGAAAAGPSLATVVSVGAGRVVAVADASVFHNSLLGEADNAAFAVAVAGEEGRPVAFAEAAHGFGESEGLAAVPARWRLALAAALAATLVWMWSRGRRLGPPEDEERPAAPPRRAYVDAMAASLAKTHRPALCARPLQQAAHRRLARRAGLPADAGDDALRVAAVHLGMPAADVDALFAPPRDDGELLVVGRAVTVALAEKESGPW
ncbi:MAG TPA: DUF4350 domain-containing protein [Acidimicrobiales bacterium]|nr:DUF4350 domain-containing protein [Acidimicrobiales bacterium]